ncbi:3-sulfinopropanoyl-CoA desulfinase [Leekyejoonella antrihumi]|uniref:Acyl-CoA dehydrogenase n=1 Tax=Leekyejoonella antrihumi TaxID=1660198 RepID=A0A563DQL3_9MICO|nr:3-sulfinopropanoyl-CoA desulfinase [Leekyejoonella antrihumi]TWP32515.1 acyl-CoA dehydrogenase [Leekyejoonella antrihumi]
MYDFDLTEAQSQLQERARELSDGPIRERAAEVDRTESYPWDTVKQLVDSGFMGMTIPVEYGGLGLSYFDVVLVVEQVARNCGITARIVVDANMGGVGAVMKYGTPDQKKTVAGYVLEGDKPAILITEPDAGSDATGMSTTAERVDGGYILNGTKYWITGGGVSHVHLVFAQVVEDGVKQGIQGFLAYRDKTDGLRIGERHRTMGLRGIPETYIHFENMFVPEEDVVRPPGEARRGFAGLMDAYNGQRVGAGMVAHGIAQGALEVAVDRVKSREQFGRPLAEFQGLQWMLADMQIGLTASRGLLYQAAQRLSPAGFPERQLAAQAKVFAAENAIRVTNDALQLFGAQGYNRALPLERMVRDARMFTIGGGTAQMLRNQVASTLLGMKLPQTRDGWLAEVDHAR